MMQLTVVHQFLLPTMNPILLFIFTKLASTAGLFVAIMVTVAWLLLQGHGETAANLFLTTIALTLTVTLLKKVFKVARPTRANLTLSSYAFPSGHAAGASFLAIVLILLTRELADPLRYLIVFIGSLTAFTVAYSRLHFKVHTLLQVTAGIVIGLLFSLLFATLL